MAFILNVATSYPENIVKQDEVRRLIKRIWSHRGEVIHQLFEKTTVKKRAFCLDLNEYKELGHIGQRNTLWKKIALHLQKKNLFKLQEKSPLDLRELNLLASVTSTGLCVPSLEALIMNHFPINHQTKRMPIFGLGCLAGVAGVNRVNDYLAGHPGDSGLLMLTELCSLTFQLKDDSIANIIGSALFGDGAAAVILVGCEHPLASKASFEILEGQSIFYNHTERIMGWDMVESGFQIVLSNEIPNLVRSHVGNNIDNFLRKKNLHLTDLSFFMAHPGGPKVLEAITEILGKKKEDFQQSWKTLEESGNTSSTSVISILEHTMKRTDLKSGDLGLMLAMGPAFCLELCLVRKC